jgi:hypothetical protein
LALSSTSRRARLRRFEASLPDDDNDDDDDDEDGDDDDDDETEDDDENDDVDIDESELDKDEELEDDNDDDDDEISSSLLDLFKLIECGESRDLFDVDDDEDLCRRPRRFPRRFALLFDFDNFRFLFDFLARELDVAVAALSCCEAMSCELSSRLGTECGELVASSRYGEAAGVSPVFALGDNNVARFERDNFLFRLFDLPRLRFDSSLDLFLVDIPSFFFFFFF